MCAHFYLSYIFVSLQENIPFQCLPVETTEKLRAVQKLAKEKDGSKVQRMLVLFKFANNEQPLQSFGVTWSLTAYDSWTEYLKPTFSLMASSSIGCFQKHILACCPAVTRECLWPTGRNGVRMGTHAVRYHQTAPLSSRQKKRLQNGFHKTVGDTTLCEVSTFNSVFNYSLYFLFSHE